MPPHKGEHAVRTTAARSTTTMWASVAKGKPVPTFAPYSVPISAGGVVLGVLRVHCTGDNHCIADRGQRVG
jgi:hypothetical protein